MPMKSPFLHCIWSERKSRLSLTRACELFLFLKGGPLPVLVPCGLVNLFGTRIRSFENHCWTVAHLWSFVHHW